MAHVIYANDRSVILRGQAGVTERLGRAAPEVKDVDVVGWMVDLVNTFDLITTPEGTFCLSCPAANPPVRFIRQPAPVGYMS